MPSNPDKNNGPPPANKNNKRPPPNNNNDPFQLSNTSTDTLPPYSLIPNPSEQVSSQNAKQPSVRVPRNATTGWESAPTSRGYGNIQGQGAFDRLAGPSWNPRSQSKNPEIFEPAGLSMSDINGLDLATKQDMITSTL